MDRPLSIAHCVEGYAPAAGGMAEVVRQLSERMAAAGHHVTVLTSEHPARGAGPINGVQVRGFGISGNAVSGIHGPVDAYLSALREGGFDIITFFAAQQWATDAALDHLHGFPGRKVFVPTGFSGLHDPRWKDYYARMPAWLSAMDMNVFHTEAYQDAAFARAHAIRQCLLIPNGAAEEEFESGPRIDFREAHGIGPKQPLVLHIGGFTGIKGQREALEIFIRAATHDAALVLIGTGMHVLERAFRRHWRFAGLRFRARFAGKRILFLETDRASTVAALRQADLFLFPSQLECSPIVLFEAMAAGVPFLASDAGNSAEIARWGNGGWIVPGSRGPDGLVRTDIGAAARKLGTVLSDGDLLRRTGEAGHRAWKEGFTWRTISERYIRLYEELVNRP